MTDAPQILAPCPRCKSTNCQLQEETDHNYSAYGRWWWHALCLDCGFDVRDREVFDQSPNALLVFPEKDCVTVWNAAKTADLIAAAEARIAELEAQVREAEAQSPASMVTAIQSALDRAHGAEARADKFEADRLIALLRANRFEKAAEHAEARVPAAYKAGMLAAAEIADRLSRENGSDYGCDLVADAARAAANEFPPEEWR